MATAFLSLKDAVKALLLQAPQIVGDRVTTNKDEPVVREHSTAINVVLVRTRGQRADVASGPVDWTTRLGIECYYRAASGDEDPTDGVDPVLKAAHERLAGQGAALAIGVEDVLPDPEIEWDVKQGDTPLASATFVVDIVHRTTGSTLVPWN
jgi:hypothetical protein